MMWLQKKDKCLDIINILRKYSCEVSKMECEVCSRDTDHWSNLVKIQTKLDALIHYIQLSRS